MCRLLSNTNRVGIWLVSLAMEAIGDITASAEVSRVEVDGVDFDSRIQGGVLVCCSLIRWIYSILTLIIIVCATE
jgi:hypothetical protein